MLILGIVADVVEMDFRHPLLLRSFQDTVIKRGFKHLGENG
jgi:hypothetical protein